MLFCDHVLQFLRDLKIDCALPSGIDVLNPYQHPNVFELCRQFYTKFYSDTNPRYLMVGINPGRFGGGLTGIPFTDPVKLDKNCGIPNSFPMKTELSADFMYSMIDAFGGLKKFYDNYYFSSVSPLGFVSNGKNLNYYDVKALQDALKPFIVEAMTFTLQGDIDRRLCYCIGEGQNHKYLTNLNEEFHWFERIVTLTHPRFIMQYKRKTMGAYIDDYVRKLSGSE